MLIWFAVMSVGGVVFVFRDPRLDHRLVVVGSLLPNAVDLVLRHGRVGPAHTLVGVVGFLAVVMAITVGRRSLRKRLLALPIGALCALALDGAWTRTKVFAWPFTGWMLPGRLFVLGRPWWVNGGLELAGVAVAVFLYQRCGLAQPSRRRAFVQSGALELVSAPTRRRR